MLRGGKTIEFDDACSAKEKTKRIKGCRGLKALPLPIQQIFLDRIAGIIRFTENGRVMTLGEQIQFVLQHEIRAISFDLQKFTLAMNELLSRKKKRKAQSKCSFVDTPEGCCQLVKCSNIEMGNTVKLGARCRTSPSQIRQKCAYDLCPARGSSIVERARRTLQYQWVLSSFSDAPSNVTPEDITADCIGNVYVCGFFQGRARIGHILLNSDIISPFIVKIDCCGNLVFVKVPVISDIADARAITTDRCGNVYITGGFVGTIQWGRFRLSATPRCLDLWVVKMSPTGKFTRAAQTFGIATAMTTGNTQPYGIVADAGQNVYLTGTEGEQIGSSARFGSFIVRSTGSFDTWIAKSDSCFTWKWVNVSVGTGIIGVFATLTTPAAGIALDGRGSLFVAGNIGGTGLPPYVTHFGSVTLTAAGFQDVFVAKASAATGDWEGAVQTNATPPPSFSVADAFDITVDCKTGDVYVVGSFGLFGATVVFGSQALTIANPLTFTQTYVSKLSNALGWIRTVTVEDRSSNVNFSMANGIAMDILSNIYVTGSYNGAPVFGALMLFSPVSDNVYFAKTTPELTWCTVTSSVNLTPPASFAHATALASSPQGNIYGIGTFGGGVRFGDFVIASPHTFVGLTTDFFVTKLHDTLTTRLLGIVVGKNADDTFSICWYRQSLQQILRCSQGVESPSSDVLPSNRRFSNLIPSFDYYRTFAGELVIGCVQELCANPGLVYYGTACTDTKMLVKRRKKISDRP